MPTTASDGRTHRRARRAGLGAVVVAALLAPLIGLGAAAAVVLAPADAVDSPERVDAVVALAGERERLRVAEGLAEDSGAVLVVSWVPAADEARDERCEDDLAEILCFLPSPVSTAGEARAIGSLSEQLGWEHIVVVTSRYHVGRAGMLVGQCVDGAELRVASATDRLRATSVLYESAGVLAGATVQRAC